jgi:hypothetical protein
MDSDETITFRCLCGKGYRVPAAKAGKRVACKACGEHIRVPGIPLLSRSSRGDILLSVGIDPEAAERKFNEEQLLESNREKAKKKTYRCTRCEDPFESGELASAYYKGELVCTGCREIQKKAPDTGEGRRVRAAVAVGEPRTGAQTFAYAGLFFLGFAGPAWTIFHFHGALAVVIGLVVAVVGGFAIRSRG